MSGAGADAPDAGPSALQLLVPGAAPLLDAVRALPGAALLAPPHVSLGDPWRGAEQAESSLEEVRAAAAAVPAVAAELTGPYAFAPDSRGRVLVHARLSPAEPVRELARALGADLRDVHLSIARVLPEGSPDAAADAVAPLLPLLVRVEHLELTVQRSGRWSRALLAPLA